MARPEDLVYSTHVGVVESCLTVEGEEAVRAHLDSTDVRFLRIVRVETPDDGVVYDDVFLKDLETVPKWMGGQPDPVNYELRVNKTLVRDIADIMKNRQAIELLRTKLGATALTPQMSRDMQLMPKDVQPPFGKWAAYGLETGGVRYELSRVAGAEQGAAELLHQTADGSFGLVSVDQTDKLHKLLRTRVGRLVEKKYTAYQYKPGFTNIGYYMPKHLIQIQDLKNVA